MQLRRAEATSADFHEFKCQVRDLVEQHLKTSFLRYESSEIVEAARYAVLGGGHRWRAIAAVAAGRIFREDACEVVLPGACGVELAHAASLVLDDLPSMDNASTRRGKDCTHRVYPRWAIDILPVFLVTMAYELNLSNVRATPEQRVLAGIETSRAGLQMIEGQVRDLKQAHASLQDEKMLLDCYRLKSGALYAAACKCGGILCGATEHEAQLLHTAGLNLGLAYQMLDDVADVVAGIAEVGKQGGMDAQKWTAVDWLGIQDAKSKSREFQETALSALAGFGREADWLRTLVLEASYKRS